jgi:hypothetical protein
VYSEIIHRKILFFFSVCLISHTVILEDEKVIKNIHIFKYFQLNFHLNGVKFRRRLPLVH